MTVTGICFVITLAITSPLVARIGICAGERPLNVLTRVVLTARLAPMTHTAPPPPLEVSGGSVAAIDFINLHMQRRVSSEVASEVYWDSTGSYIGTFKP